jgi:competence protein ComEA
MRHFSLGQQKILIVLAVCLLGILYFKSYYSPPAPSEEITKEIVVEIQGEAQNPGVYIFRSSPTLKEALDKAGALNEEVPLKSKSSLEILETGTLITIQRVTPSPLAGEGKPARRTSSLAGGGEGELIKIKIGRMDANKLLVFNVPLDLNRVSMEDLCLLMGIGESLAREIITYRERRRGFRSVEELKNIKGIGEKKWKNFKPFLTVSSG